MFLLKDSKNIIYIYIYIYIQDKLRKYDQNEKYIYVINLNKKDV